MVLIFVFLVCVYGNVFWVGFAVQVFGYCNLFVFFLRLVLLLVLCVFVSVWLCFFLIFLSVFFCIVLCVVPCFGLCC